MDTKFLFRQNNCHRPSWKILFLVSLFIMVTFLIQCTPHQAQNSEPMSESSSSPIQISSTKKLAEGHPSVQNPSQQSVPSSTQKEQPLSVPVQQVPPSIEHAPSQPSPVLPNLNQKKPTKIRVDLSKQELQLYAEDQILKSYSISTSKYGIGNQAGSNKTPLGLHMIQNKIGEGVTEGTIFKGRVNTKKLAKINGETEDMVTSRIMWLKGLEKGKNTGTGIDSYQRCIYIHGTAAEKDIGKPASHGCVRMYNKDVIELFDLVEEGLQVEIFCSQQKPETNECIYDEQVEKKIKESEYLSQQ